MHHYDLAIKNGMILTMNAFNTIIENGSIGIEGDSITYIGQEAKETVHADVIIDAKGGIVLPGLINGHTHAAMTLFRGLADDLPLMDWLNHYIFPVESKMDSEFVYLGTILACAEMIMSGTTTFCDMYLFEDETAKAGKASGLRCLVGEVLYDFDSPNYGSIEKGLQYTEWLINKWQGDPLVSIAVEPHATFTCSPDLLRATHDLALKYQVPLIIHLAETHHEVVEIQKKYGKRPVEHLRALGILGPHLIADHCVHLNDHEIEVLAEYKVNVIHNPESNMKLASGIAPIYKMLTAGIPVGLGTDGCASNNNLDLLLEMDMAAKLHKVSTMDPTVMDALTVLRMATIDGAKALKMDQYIGSIEKGKKADIVIIDTNKPHLIPMYNPYSHIVYAARGDDITDMIVNGNVVMKNKEILTLDLADIMTRAAKKSKEILGWLSFDKGG
ncbi:MAG: amidohydrolase [Deltaproteobacteria bacterium]|nr:amidohydrolase [Deltaproteobacteria bacterium]